MNAFAFWYCRKCKEFHISFCPRFMGRLRFYWQFRGEAPMSWIITKIANPKPKGQMK